MTKPIRLLLLAAACALPGAAPPPAPAPIVHISNFRFGPATITVPAGTTVTWINDDEEPHTVTAADRSCLSPLLGNGAHYVRTYAVPGEYPYFCSLHPHMIGRIVVVRG